MDSIPLSVGMAFAAGIVGAITLLSAILLEDDVPSRGGGIINRDAQTAVVTNEQTAAATATATAATNEATAPEGVVPESSPEDVQKDVPQGAEVGDEVGAPVGAEVGAPVGAEVGAPVGAEVGAPVGASQVATESAHVIGYLTNAKAAVFVGRGKPLSNLLSKHYDERQGITRKISGMFAKKQPEPSNPQPEPSNPQPEPSNQGITRKISGFFSRKKPPPSVPPPPSLGGASHTDSHVGETPAEGESAAVVVVSLPGVEESSFAEEAAEATHAVEATIEDQKATYILPTNPTTNGGAASSSHRRSAAYIRDKIARKMRKRYTPTS